MSAKLPKKPSADGVVGMLYAKYRKDFFCTSEASIGGRPGSGRGSMRRLDFLAIAPSWSSPAILGFEVKVSRADFVGDEKFTNYLPYCNRFWFVTAPGIVRPGEIPDHVGWMEAGGRLVIKKKAPALPDPKPENAAELFKSLLIRHHYGRHAMPGFAREDRIAQWKEYLAGRREERDMGNAISRKVSLALAAASTKEFEANRKVESMETFLKALEAAGVEREDFFHRSGHRMSLENLARGLVRDHLRKEEEIIKNFRHLGTSVEAAAKQFRESIEQTVRAIERRLAEADRGEVVE